jgi:hypothetical protein
MLSEGNEVSIVVKENSRGSLLIIGVITWIEDFDSWFLAWLYDSWSDTVSI